MALRSDRLIVRPPVDADRERFVELFTSDSFMVFAGRLDVAAANERFDHMLEMAKLVPYAKQPIVEAESGTIVGYTGVDVVTIDGVDRLEWGWRLVAEARGSGYATEAVLALLVLADRSSDGEMLCLIDPDNAASHGVAEKVGFRWRERIDWLGAPVDILVRSIGAGGPPLGIPIVD